MKYLAVSIRDRAGDVFSAPAFVTSIGVAKRSFSDEINRKAENNQLNSHPEDFDLYEVGSFDDQGGQLEPCVPRQLAIGKDEIRS
jgi:hypothetical protein